MARAKLKNFTDAQEKQFGKNPHEIQSLSQIQQASIDFHLLMKIKGKANHHLSVLIPKKIEETLELLVNSQEEYGIASETVYLCPNQKAMY